jgi:hypothetical protein
VLPSGPGDLRVSWRWFRPADLLGVATLPAIPVLLLWSGSPWRLTGGGRGPDGLPDSLLPVLLAGLLACGYLLAARILNSTVVTVSGGRIRVRHGPLPWPGSGELDAGGIVQIFVRSRTVRRGSGPRGRRTRTVFVLAALLEGGGVVELVDRLETRDQALWLECEIEKTLGIADRVVPGEILR